MDNKEGTETRAATDGVQHKLQLRIQLFHAKVKERSALTKRKQKKIHYGRE